jgi:hypothetical protein
MCNLLFSCVWWATRKGNNDKKWQSSWCSSSCWSSSLQRPNSSSSRFFGGQEGCSVTDCVVPYSVWPLSHISDALNRRLSSSEIPNASKEAEHTVLWTSNNTLGLLWQCLVALLQERPRNSSASSFLVWSSLTKSNSTLVNIVRCVDFRVALVYIRNLIS